MDFKSYTIQPKGRLSHGTYASSTNLTRMVTETVYGGDATTNDLGNNDKNKEEENKNWLLFLSTTTNNFNGFEVAANPIMVSTQLIGYSGNKKGQTFVGDITTSATSATYDITGIAQSGMTISVSGNGTSATTIYITVDSNCEEKKGKLTIPCSVYLKTSDMGDDKHLWNQYQSNCMSMDLNYTWSISDTSSSSYMLDLTNENASVNVNSAGTIYTASTATLECQAKLYMGTEPVTSATYSISILPAYNAHGVSINENTGVLSWESNFGFDGSNLPIRVIASVDGSPVLTKTMTISKNYPAADGKDAESRWIVLSANEAKINVDATSSPSAITAIIMHQIGGNQPEVTSGKVFYSFDDYEPVYELPATGATIHSGNSQVNFVLRKGDVTTGQIYEQETVQILYNIKGDKGDKGDTGEKGDKGDKGEKGDNGENGVSPYRLSLSNDNASINCYNNGTIMPNAYKPSCIGKTWLGNELQTGATYTIETNASGVTSSVTNGVITIATSANTFGFDGYVTEIKVKSYISNKLADESIMTITKSLQGVKGDNGQNGNTPYISGGTWWIGGVDTHIKAEAEDGNTPEIGTNGNWWIGGVDTGVKARAEDGVSITGVTEYYAASSSSTVSPAKNTFITSIPSDFGPNKPYLWNFERIHYNKGQADQDTTLAMISRYGADGKGISAITEYYQISSSSTYYSSSWSTSVVVPTQQKPYLWNYEKFTYSDGTTGKTSPAVIGIRGENGARGVSITGVNEYYCATVNAIAPAKSSYTLNTIPSDYGVDKPYLWNYEQINYSEGNSTETSPSIIGRYGKDGNAGKGISAITEYYQINNSYTTAPTNWSTTFVAPTSANPYLWNYEKFTYSDNTSGKTSPVIIGIRGNDGTNGTNGESITVEFSVNGSSNWHTTFTNGDKYMREKIGSGSWSSPIKIVGENGAQGAQGPKGDDGENGADGEWTSFVFKASKERPDAPYSTDPIPVEEGWSDEPPVFDYVTVNITPVGNWTRTLTDNGYSFTSNAINHNQRTIERLYFTTYEDNVNIQMRLFVSSEANYDKGYISKLDTAFPVSANPTTAQYTVMGSGNYNGLVSMAVPTKGPHFIELEYSKDGSGTGGTDTTTVLVYDANDIWMTKATIIEGAAAEQWSEPIKINNQNIIPAISYWLDVKPSEVILDQNTNTLSVSAITANARMQIGEDAPIPFNGKISYCKIKKDGTETSLSAYTGPIAVTSGDFNTYNYVRLYLHYGSSINDVTLDSEDVDLLTNGLNGAQGAQGAQGETGRAGAVVRGPIKWKKETRMFYNGQPNTTYPDSEKWIDIINKDGVIYKCTTTYNQSWAYDWENYSSNWTVATEYDFVATNLLLANDAKINFLTGNDIYLMNEDELVTGGARGTDEDNKIAFWAGSDDLHMNTAPFRVDSDGKLVATDAQITGSISATSGTFGGTLNGVSGTFQHLIAVDSYGNSGGSIDFQSNGIFFNGYCRFQNTNGTMFDNKIMHQGGVFYGADIWCRGGFGHNDTISIVMYGSYGYLYPYGLNGTSVYFACPTGTYNGYTYYEIPTYITTSIESLSGYVGCCVDMIMFRIVNNSSTFRYKLNMYKGSEVTLFNLNDTAKNNYVYWYTNGSLTQLPGGGAVKLFNVGYSNLNPTVSYSIPGAGIMQVTPIVDSNWS